MTDQHSLPLLPEPSGMGLTYTISDMVRYGDARAAYARKAEREIVLKEWADHMTRMNNAIKELK